MAHSLTSQMLAQTQAAMLMPALFLEVDTPSGNVYFWDGYGNIVWNGQTWVGAGYFLKIDAVTETNMLQAAGVQISLSGVPSNLRSLVLQSLKRFYPCKLWVGALDATLAVVPDPFLIFNGLVDSGSMVASGKAISVTITAESRLMTLRTPRERHFTDQDARIDAPSDGGFKFVEFLQNAIITWGTG